jgi:uncharacterized protein YodC (DUF2158 family)
MNPAASNRTAETPAGPRFKIGQDVHLKSGGREMIVNQCTRTADGGFIVDTIWFGEGRAEEHGTFQEEQLEARIPLDAMKR